MDLLISAHLVRRETDAFGNIFLRMLHSEQPWKIESVSSSLKSRMFAAIINAFRFPSCNDAPMTTGSSGPSSSYGNWGSADTKADAQVAATAVRNCSLFLNPESHNFY